MYNERKKELIAEISNLVIKIGFFPNPSLMEDCGTMELNTMLADLRKAWEMFEVMDYLYDNFPKMSFAPISTEFSAICTMYQEKEYIADTYDNVNYLKEI